MNHFENPPTNNPEAEKTPEQQEQIENTTGFERALAEGQLDEAEQWLMENRDRGDARWLDHRSLSLFRARRQISDFAGAKKMVELADGSDAQAGRRAVLEKESGLPFDEI